jgi:hypothetical protein
VNRTQKQRKSRAKSERPPTRLEHQEKKDMAKKQQQQHNSDKARWIAQRRKQGEGREEGKGRGAKRVKIFRKQYSK